MKSHSAPELPESLASLFTDQSETLTLENGLKVVFQQIPAHPVVSTHVWIRSGSIHEAPHVGSGLSHFLEHLLFKGTERRPTGAIAREIQAYGGSINAYTAFDRTVYYIDSPKEAFAQSLDILADMVFHATLPEAEVLKEKDVILREIDMTLDDPDRILSRGLFRTAYSEHPFRFPVIGLRPLFAMVDRDMLWEYYQGRYQPDNAVLSIAGDFQREELERVLEATFAKLPQRMVKQVFVPEEPEQLAFRESRMFGDYLAARGSFGFKIPSIRHKDAPALDILSAIIGSGHSGRLRQKLREDLGLVHEIQASAWNPREPGLFSMRYQCDPEKASKAEEAILTTCSNYAETGFTQQELEKARQFACISEIQARQTSSGLAARLGLLSAIVGDLHYPERYFERIFSLNIDDLGSLCARTFQNHQLTLATLLPKSLKPQRKSGGSSNPVPEFQEHRLSNGARVLWQRDNRLPRTWMRFAGLGGPLFEDPDYHGATSLLTTLLARDTKFQTSSRIAQNLEGKGGFLLDSSGNNTFSLALEIPPESATFGLHTLRDAVRHPAFNPATLSREREAQIAHLKDLNDEVFDFGRQAMRRHFFGKHPFAFDPCGTEKTTLNIDSQYLQSFYQRLVVASNAVLVLTGDFDPDVLLPEVESFLSALPDREFRKKLFAFPQPATLGTLYESMPREQAVLFEAYPDVGFVPEGEILGKVACELLSDMSGPLFTAVREERSLAYYVGASRMLGSDFGCFYLYAGTHPSTTGPVYECFDAELDRIRNGLLAQEQLHAAITRLKSGIRFSLQSPAARAARVTVNALYGKPIMDWIEYESRLDAVDLDSLTRFVKEQFSPDKRMRLCVTPN